MVGLNGEVGTLSRQIGDNRCLSGAKKALRQRSLQWQGGAREDPLSACDHIHLPLQDFIVNLKVTSPPERFTYQTVTTFPARPISLRRLCSCRHNVLGFPGVGEAKRMIRQTSSATQFRSLYCLLWQKIDFFAQGQNIRAGGANGPVFISQAVHVFLHRVFMTLDGLHQLELRAAAIEVVAGSMNAEVGVAT